MGAAEIRVSPIACGQAGALDSSERQIRNFLCFCSHVITLFLLLYIQPSCVRSPLESRMCTHKFQIILNHATAMASELEALIGATRAHGRERKLSDVERDPRRVSARHRAVPGNMRMGTVRRGTVDLGEGGTPA